MQRDEPVSRRTGVLNVNIRPMPGVVWAKGERVIIVKEGPDGFELERVNKVGTGSLETSGNKLKQVSKSFVDFDKAPDITKPPVFKIGFEIVNKATNIMANVKLSPEVTATLKLCTITGNSVVLPGQLDRKAYEAVNKVIMLAGGKWNKSAKAHLFEGDAKKALGLAIDTGVVVDKKKLRQAFYTPENIADEVAQLANVRACKVLEPSAGGGALVDACRKAGARWITAVEMEPKCKEELEKKADDVIIGDFLEHKTDGIYNRVVMNPPFTKGQDVKHVTHALKQLLPGGQLFAIVPNKDCPKLKALGARTVKAFDAGAFRSSGTNVATRLITITK